MPSSVNRQTTASLRSFLAMGATVASLLSARVACAQNFEPDAPYTGADAVTVRVSVWNRNGVPPILETSARNASWRPICVAPCNLAVDPRLTYRLNGEALKQLGYVPHQGWVSGETSVNPSAPFRVSPANRNIDLTIHSAQSDHFEMAGYSALFATLLLGSGIPVLAAEHHSKGLRYGYGAPATVIGSVFVAGAVFFFADHTWVSDQHGNKIAHNDIDLGHGLRLGSNGLVF